MPTWPPSWSPRKPEPGQWTLNKMGEGQTEVGKDNTNIRDVLLIANVRKKLVLIPTLFLKNRFQLTFFMMDCFFLNCKNYLVL